MSDDIGAVHLPPPRQSADAGAVKLSPGAKREQIGESPRDILTGAIGDLVKAGDRPGAVPLTGAPGTKTPLGVVLKPEGAVERATSAAVMAPAMAAIPGGALARIATSAGIGGLTELASGEKLSKAGWSGVLDGIATGISEGLMRGAGALLNRSGAASRAFEWASKAPGEALDAIRSRLPKGKFLNVPTLGTAKMTVDEAVAKLKTLTGDAYKQAREEIAHELSRLDAQRVTGPRPFAGKVFKDRTSQERFEPSRGSRVAETARRALGSDAARGTADAVAMQPAPGGLPVGVVAGAALGEAPGAVKRHLLPAAEFMAH